LLWRLCLGVVIVYDVEPETIAQTIRRLRKERGLAQEGLAFKAGLSTSTLSRIELGKHAPTVTTLRRIAGALDVTLAELLEPDSGEA
jgi:transcriptional regulator with XRE-family HTH domain